MIWWHILLTAVATPGGSRAVHIYTQTVHIYTQTVHIYTQTVHIYTQTAHIYTQRVHIYTKTVHIYTQTVHIYTQTIHRTTQKTTKWEECRPCPVFALKLRKKHGKTSVRVAEECKYKAEECLIKPSTNKAINTAQLCTSFCGGYDFTQLHHKIT